MTRYLVDTNVALYWLSGLAYPPHGLLQISVITELELLSFHGLAPREASQVAEFIRRVKVVGLLARVKLETIELRRRHRLKLPDAIIAGTAMATGARLLTADERLLRLTEVKAERVEVRRG